MIISIDQARNYASAAGFTGKSLDIIVAIAQAESGLDTTIINPNDPHGGSFGILQINGVHGLSRSQMFDPAYSFRFAYQLSKQGTDFHDWSTYTSGKYKETPAWKSSASAKGTSNTPAPVAQVAQWTAADSLRTWPWATKDGKTVNLNNPYMSTFEPSHGYQPQYGVGFPLPLGTKVTSLTSGQVLNAWYGGYAGVVLVRAFIPGHGYATLYYLHLDHISVKVGDVLKVGQEVGLSGGQLSGGEHPVTCCSTGAHLDVGINNPNFPNKLGDNFDPTPWLNDLMLHGPPVADRVGQAAGSGTATFLASAQALSEQLATGTGPLADDFGAIEQRIDSSMQFFPIDWNSITKNVSWWDWILPWQWGYTGDQLRSNFSRALGHNMGAVLLRAMIVILGLSLIMGFFGALLVGSLKATGGDELLGVAGNAAATAGKVAAVAAA